MWWLIIIFIVMNFPIPFQILTCIYVGSFLTNKINFTFNNEQKGTLNNHEYLACLTNLLSYKCNYEHKWGQSVLIIDSSLQKKNRPLCTTMIT